MDEVQINVKCYKSLNVLEAAQNSLLTEVRLHIANNLPSYGLNAC